MLLALLGIIAVSLTCTMIATRNPLLGWPSALFFFLFGVQAYVLHTTTWDVYYSIFFVSAIGMTIFTAFAAFGLRERHDTLGDEEDEGGVPEYKGKNDSEGGDSPRNNDDDNRHSDDHEELFYGEQPKPSVRTQRLRGRAKARRTGDLE